MAGKRKSTKSTRQRPKSGGNKIRGAGRRRKDGRFGSK